MRPAFIPVGQIVNAHGIRGEVRVQPWADSPDFLCQFKTLYVDSSHWPIQVERARVHKNMVILKLQGVTFQKNGALALTDDLYNLAYAESASKLITDGHVVMLGSLIAKDQEG